MKEIPAGSPPPYSGYLCGASVAGSLYKTRQNIVAALVAMHIQPHLDASALAGLSHTTLLLVPSNVSSLHPVPFRPTDLSSYNNRYGDFGDGETFPNEEIIGFPSSRNLSLVRLHETENSIEFWRQDAVVRELETQLKANLRATGCRVIENDGSDGRHESGNGPPEDVWKFADEEKVGEGDAKVAVEIRDLSLRIENAMGLYETRMGKVIKVEIAIGS